MSSSFNFRHSDQYNRNALPGQKGRYVSNYLKSVCLNFTVWAGLTGHLACVILGVLSLSLTPPSYLS